MKRKGKQKQIKPWNDRKQEYTLTQATTLRRISSSAKPKAANSWHTCPSTLPVLHARDHTLWVPLSSLVHSLHCHLFVNIETLILSRIWSNSSVQMFVTIMSHSCIKGIFRMVIFNERPNTWPFIRQRLVRPLRKRAVIGDGHSLSVISGVRSRAHTMAQTTPLTL